MASPNARRLRSNQTEAEKTLWSKLRRQQLDGYRFRRQHPIGPYIVDFVCLAEKLVVEVDGSQHADDQDPDADRTAWLESRGYRVVRFWNNDVSRNIDGVVAVIRDAVRAD